jgi:RNA polymerase sigma-70 factor (ECF subfamily)
MPDPSDPTIDVPADAQRFAQAVLPHVDAAYNLARWLSGDAQDADDIVQDACLRAFRLFGGFRGGDGRPWLLAIVRNTWFSECARRKQARTQPWQDDGTDPQAELPPDDEAIAYGADPAALLARADDVRRMQAALARLPLPPAPTRSRRRCAAPSDARWPMRSTRSRCSIARSSCCASWKSCRTRRSRASPTSPSVP